MSDGDTLEITVVVVVADNTGVGVGEREVDIVCERDGCVACVRECVCVLVVIIA